MGRYCYYCKNKLKEEVKEVCVCKGKPKTVYGDILRKGKIFICSECKGRIIETIYKTDFDDKVLFHNKCSKCGALSYMDAPITN